MRLTSISITNMAGFEAFQTTLPAVVLVQGRNGDGKSSFLDCLKYGFGRGHDEDMIHGDAPEGEILIEFENGAALKCRAVRDRNETIRSWRAPGSKRFVVSRAEIDAIGNALSYDPLALMDRTDAERVETLLRVMPIQCSPDELKAAVGNLPFDSDALSDNALATIEGIHKDFYAQRRELNTASDTQAKHALELEKSLPADPPQGGDWNAEAEALEAEKNGIEQHQAEQVAQIRDAFEEAKEGANQEYTRKLAAAAEERDALIEDARTQANQAAAQVRQHHAAHLEKLAESIAVAQERARALAQAEGTRQAADKAKREAAQLRDRANQFHQALSRLAQLKESVAGRLQIKGVSVENGRIVRDENGAKIPFARWNTEAKMRFCLRVAVLAHGEAGFLCIDNAEHFDAAHRQALLQTATKYSESAGLQFLIASVSDQPLTVQGA